MTDRLSLYNEALTTHCGERSIASLTESREPRRLLDEVWNNGGVDACLEEGFWQFATRSVLINYDTEITPAFGHNRAFTKPSDWVKTTAVCSDEFFKSPLINYTDEAGYWYTSIDEIYVKYVSNGNSYGNDLTVWSQNFTDYVAAHFARKIIKKLTGDEKKQTALEKTEKALLQKAKNHDASGSPTKFPPPGSWNTSRTSVTGRNRSTRGSLIG